MKPYNHNSMATASSSSEDIDSHHSPSPNAQLPQPAFPSSSHARAASQPKISPVGPLTLQTDIDKFREPSDAELVTETRGDSASFNFDDDDDDDDGFRSADEDEIEEEELEGKYYSNTAAGAGRSRSGLSSASGYTIEEERRVVKGFDRRLVPFLGLLYMLSFLDRSSGLFCSLHTYIITFLDTANYICRYWKCENSRTSRRPESLIFAV